MDTGSSRSDGSLTADVPRHLQVETYTFTCYCEECFAPATATDRGEVCSFHYAERRPQCESCGVRPSDIVEHGYYVCSSCRNGGRI